MSIRVALNHKTRYLYTKPVWLSPQVVRLRPAPHCRTPVASYSLKVLPEEHFINWQQDPYSNRLARLVFPNKTSEFSVEVDLVAELSVTNPFDFFLEKCAEMYPFQYDSILSRELAPYLEVQTPGPKLQTLIRGLSKQTDADGRLFSWAEPTNSATDCVDFDPQYRAGVSRRQRKV